MKWIIAFLLSFGVLFGVDSAPTHPKIIYVKLLNQDVLKDVYVGQTIQVRYSLLLLDGASFLSSEFVYEDKKNASSAQLLNPASTWKKQKDGTYTNTFVYKIKSPRFVLPALEVSALAKDKSYKDVSRVESLSLEAIELGGEKYSGVLAKTLQILQVKSEKTEDGKDNIVIFQIQASGSNLMDLKLPLIEEQGFMQKIKSKKGQQEGFYYCVLPSTQKELRFTYFNLDRLAYEEIQIPIMVEMEVLGTQSDLDPKNNFLIFSNLILLILVCLSLLLALIFRKNRILMWIYLALAMGLAAYLAYVMLVSEVVKLKKGALVRILPTERSTLLQEADGEIPVELMGRYKDFYKVKLDDSRIGWVKKEECE